MMKMRDKRMPIDIINSIMSHLRKMKFLIEMKNQGARN